MTQELDRGKLFKDRIQSWNKSRQPWGLGEATGGEEYHKKQEDFYLRKL